MVGPKACPMADSQPAQGGSPTSWVAPNHFRAPPNRSLKSPIWFREAPTQVMDGFRAVLEAHIRQKIDSHLVHTVGSHPLRGCAHRFSDQPVPTQIVWSTPTTIPWCGPLGGTLWSPSSPLWSIPSQLPSRYVPAPRSLVHDSDGSHHCEMLRFSRKDCGPGITRSALDRRRVHGGVGHSRGERQSSRDAHRRSGSRHA